MIQNNLNSILGKNLCGDDSRIKTLANTYPDCYEKTRQIIKDKNLHHIPYVEKKIFSIKIQSYISLQRIAKSFPENLHLYEEEFLMCPGFSYWDGALTKALSGKQSVAEGCLMLAWKRDSPPEEDILLGSKQSAGTYRSLNDAGFVFRHFNSHSFFDEKGNRHIEYFDVDSVISGPRSSFIKVPHSFIKAMSKGETDPYQFSYSGLTPDHKCPVKASRERSIKPATLTKDMSKEEVLLYFQFVTKSTNSIKGGVCKKCINNKNVFNTIDLLPHDKMSGLYKTNWDPKTCVGCYFYDPTLPQHPELSLSGAFDKKLDEWVPLANKNGIPHSYTKKDGKWCGWDDVLD